VITVLLLLSLVIRGVISAVARGALYGFGTVDQLPLWGAVGPHTDHVEADSEFNADCNPHSVAQITTSMNTVELFL
jgi:hypothetical protein